MAARIVCPILNGPSNGSCTHTHTHRGLRHLTFEKIKFQFFYFQEKKKAKGQNGNERKIAEHNKKELPIFMKKEKKNHLIGRRPCPPAATRKKFKKLAPHAQTSSNQIVFKFHIFLPSFNLQNRNCIGSQNYLSQVICMSINIFVMRHE